MTILPVLDLMAGQIVRGIAGRRAEYRSIVSGLTDSAEPLAIAQALSKHFGFREFYLADLDAIRAGAPNLAVYQQLQEAGFRLSVDAGLRTHDDPRLTALLGARVARIIVGLESIDSPEDLAHINAEVGPERVIFSLDLQAGRPLGNLERWGTDDPFTLAERAVRTLGVRRLIVLDLACVGVGNGIGTETLCARVKRAFPDVHLSAGGGVRGIDDVRRLRAIGIDQVLVASALHDGRIAAADVKLG